MIKVGQKVYDISGGIWAAPVEKIVTEENIELYKSNYGTLIFDNEKEAKKHSEMNHLIHNYYLTL